MEQDFVAHQMPREPRERIYLLVIFGLSLATLLILTAPVPGPWYDEFWTRYFSDPSISLQQALTERWVADIHPPLFSYLQWLSAHVYRLPIEQARRLNIIPLTLLALFLVLLGKAEPRNRSFIAVLSISLGSCYFFVTYFAELRSYFTGICAFTALTVVVVVQDRQMREGGRTSSTLLWCGYAVALFVCLNIHYLTAAMTVVLVAMFGVAALIGGDRRRFVVYLFSGVVAAAPLVAFFIYQRDMIVLLTRDYWLVTDLRTSAHIIWGTISAPVYHAHGFRAVAWVIAIVLLFLTKTRLRMDPTTVILLLTLLAEIALAFVYGWATAAIIDRYLIPLSILSTATLAAVLSRQIYETRWLLALFIFSSLVSVVIASVDRWKDHRWDEAAQYLSARQRLCPGARVVPMQRTLTDHTPNTVQNNNEAYAYMAGKWGLTLGNVDEPSSRPRDLGCPDYYWADNYYGEGKSDGELLADFGRRWPNVRGCKVVATRFPSASVVFEVTGDPASCNR